MPHYEIGKSPFSYSAELPILSLSHFPPLLLLYSNLAISSGTGRGGSLMSKEAFQKPTDIQTAFFP